MPILENPRHETFAQARAWGARLDDAYEDAGFVLHKGHSSRLARRPEVAERIAELRADRNVAATNSPHRLIAGLLRMAWAGEESEDTARVKEARLALVDAARLLAAAAEAHRRDQSVILEQPGDESAPAAPAALPEGPSSLPQTCPEPARGIPRPAARRPLDGPSPAAILPAPAARLPAALRRVG